MNTIEDAALIDAVRQQMTRSVARQVAAAGNLANVDTPVPSLEREADRLEALRSCAIIDTHSDADFDDLVAVASVIAEAPQAWIAFVDETRWWVKAWVGHAPRELPRTAVLCAESMVTAEPMVERAGWDISSAPEQAPTASAEKVTDGADRSILHTAARSTSAARS